MDRTQRLLALVLAAQLVILGILNFAFPSSRTAAREQPLLPALASMTPQKVEIGDGAGASLTLARDGGVWRLGSPEGYPAAADKVEKLIEDVEALSASRPVASNRSSHAALKVADDAFERRIRIWEKADGKPSAELLVGTAPRLQMSHVRVGGKDAVYEASGLNAFDVPVDPGSWIERTLVPVPSDSVAAIAISNAKGSFELERKDGRWAVRAPASRTKAALDPAKVENLVRSMSGMSLEGPAGPESDAAYGLGAPVATVTFTRAGGDTAAAGRVVVRIGAPVPGKEGERYAARAGFGHAVTLPPYVVNQVLDASLAGMLAK